VSVKIVFTISKTGEVSERVEGATGESCESLTRPIEQALGGQVLTHDHTLEYYEQTDATQEQSGV
jgi:hypothetical protein